MTNQPRKLRVFLCHASQDKPVVRELYQRLLAKAWIDPWLDEEKLLPGQDWDMEIEKAVEAADTVIVCLSNNSVSKEGYIQRELRFVLDIALEKPEGTIFVVPVRFDDCELPRRLRSWHYVDFFPIEQQDSAYEKLLQALEVRSSQVYSKSKKDDGEKAAPKFVEVVSKISEDKKPFQQQEKGSKVYELSKTVDGNRTGMGGSILQILFFALAAFDAIGTSDDVVEMLMGSFAILTGIVFLRRKKIPAGIVFKISVIAYLILQGLGYQLEELIPFGPYLTGIAAIVSGGVIVYTLQAPKKSINYAAISFAVFLFLVGVYYIVTNFNSYPSFIGELDTLILITGIVTSALLVRDL